MCIRCADRVGAVLPRSLQRHKGTACERKVTHRCLSQQQAPCNGGNIVLYELHSDAYEPIGEQIVAPDREEQQGAADGVIGLDEFMVATADQHGTVSLLC